SGGNGYLQQAFLWKQGVITDLDGLSETPNSGGLFINSKSQVVGGAFTCDFSIRNAFLWEQGSMVDLNTLISPNSPFHLYWAGFIDDGGENRRVRHTSRRQFTRSLVNSVRREPSWP